MTARLCHINLARGFRGGERQTELLIRALAARGLSQTAIVRRGQPLAIRLQEVPGLTLLPIGKPFAAHVLKGRGQLLHAHDGHGAKFAAMAERLTGAPYVITRRISKRPGNSRWTRSVFRRASAVVAVAGSVADDLRDYLPELAPDVIHSALTQARADAETCSRIRRRWPSRYRVVNTAALVHSQKGQRHLIAAARRLAHERPDMLFILLGEGRDRDSLEAEAADLDNVVFEGFVDNVQDYLATADAFVLPSLHEGIGGACLDAMAFGLPVVASAVDGVPEIVAHEQSGLLVPAGDDSALGQALMRVHDDPAWAQSLGKQGRAMAAAHHPDRMAEHYLAVYDRVSRRFS